MELYSVQNIYRYIIYSTYFNLFLYLRDNTHLHNCMNFENQFKF